MDQFVVDLGVASKAKSGDWVVVLVTARMVNTRQMIGEQRHTQLITR